VCSSAYFHETDVRSFPSQLSLFKSTLSNPNIPRIDYVFANAGILECGYLLSPDGSKEEWREPDMKTIDINVTGVLYTTNLAVQAFRKQQVKDGFRGKIVVTASVA